jgi:hypothetical protein
VVLLAKVGVHALLPSDWYGCASNAHSLKQHHIM